MSGRVTPQQSVTIQYNQSFSSAPISSSAESRTMDLKLFAEKALKNTSSNFSCLTNWDYYQKLFQTLYYLQETKNSSLFIDSYKSLNKNLKKKLLEMIFQDPSKIKQSYLENFKICIDENLIDVSEINQILFILYSNPYVRREYLLSNSRRYSESFDENIKRFVDFIFSKHQKINSLAKNRKEKYKYYFFIISSDKELYSNIIQQNYLSKEFHDSFLHYIFINKKYEFQNELLALPFLQIEPMKLNLFIYFLKNDLEYLKKIVEFINFTEDEKKRILPYLVRSGKTRVALLIDKKATHNILKTNLITRLDLKKINITSPDQISIKTIKGLIHLENAKFSDENKIYIISQMLIQSMVDEAILFSKPIALEMLKTDMNTWLRKIYGDNIDYALAKIDEKFGRFIDKLYHYYGLCKYKHSYTIETKEHKDVKISSFIFFRKWLLNIINDSFTILHLSSPHLIRMKGILIDNPIYKGAIDNWLKLDLSYNINRPTHSENIHLFYIIYENLYSTHKAVPELAEIINNYSNVGTINAAIAELKKILKNSKKQKNISLKKQLEHKIYLALASSHRFHRKIDDIIAILKKLSTKDANNTNYKYYKSLLKDFILWKTQLEHLYSESSIALMKPEEALIVCTTANSCMNIGIGSLKNKYLLSSLCDAKNKVICIRGKNGNIKARAVIRFLFNKKTYAPALFLEPMYSKMPSLVYQEEIVRYAMKMSKILNIPLYLSGQRNSSYQEFSPEAPSNNIELASLGKALFGYECVDSISSNFSDICSGEFTLSEKIYRT